MTHAPFSPYDSLGLLVKRAQQAFRVALDAALASVGLSTAQYATLAAVAADPGLSNADLARRVFVTPQTMHGVVAGMERESWIVRRPGAGRSVAIRLTETGQTVLAAGNEAAAEVERRMTVGVPRADLEATHAVLLACCVALEAT